MFTPFDASLFLKQLILPFLSALLLAALVFGVLKYQAHQRLQRMLKQREGVTQASFTEHLEKYGVDPIIAASTYRYLQEVQLVRFPIMAGDNLDEDLGLDSTDIRQTILELSVALNREYSPGVRSTPVVTVEDLVRLLQASPRSRQSSARHHVAA